jgi:hypothetical protein
MIKNETRIAIDHKGAVIIENATIYRQGETVAAIALNMETRYADIAGRGNDENGFPQIGITANSNSEPLDKDYPQDSITEITFLDFAGWNIFSAEVDKSSVLICLTKN